MVPGPSDGRPLAVRDGRDHGTGRSRTAWWLSAWCGRPINILGVVAG